MTDTSPNTDTPTETASHAPRHALIAALAIIIALGLTASAVTVGYLIGSRANKSSPGDTSVDAGFIRDMATHHDQAIQMAGFVRDNSTDPTIALLALDIELGQQFQVGQMQGWLDNWGLPRSSDAASMAWMGAAHMAPNGLMPGMATPADIDQLHKMSGKQLDVRFLQLMIRHHQGALPMATYAAKHAAEPYLRTLANKILTAQTSEIAGMEQLLRERGATPLPPNSGH